jgi:hypothetical protein
MLQSDGANALEIMIQRLLLLSIVALESSLARFFFIKISPAWFATV